MRPHNVAEDLAGGVRPMLAVCYRHDEDLRVMDREAITRVKRS
jgi:hypothetical protein